MAAMLSLPLDYELINAATESLNDTHWPARLMAIYLLAKFQDKNFSKVLEWTVRHDSNRIVRDMAVALGASVPERPEQPLPPTLQETPAEPAANKGPLWDEQIK